MDREELIAKICNDLLCYIGNLSASGATVSEILQALMESEDLEEYVRDYLTFEYPGFQELNEAERQELIAIFISQIKNNMQALIKHFSVNKLQKLSLVRLRNSLWFLRRSMARLEKQLKNISNQIYLSQGLDELEARRVRSMESAAAILLKVLVAREKSLLLELKELEKELAGATDTIDLSLEEVDSLEAPVPLEHNLTA